MAGIKHIFTSVTPDSPNTALIRPSNWNEVHDIPATGIQIGDATTNEMTAVAAGAGLQYLRSNVTNATYEFSALPSVVCTDYNFTRTSSQPISTAGTYAFELTTLPPGLGGAVVAPNYTITGATNNGSGLVRITCYVAPPNSVYHSLETGMVVVVSGVGGVPGANGTFVVTRINYTDIDLVGSTFSGAYTSGGTFQQRPHYLYLSGGTGTAEACPVISYSGTIVNLFVQSAKGGIYNITSATAGIQEAVYANARNLILPRGFHDVAATITLDGAGVRLQGMTPLSSVLARVATFTSGDVIRCMNDAGPVFRDFGIYNYRSVQVIRGAAISGRNQTNYTSCASNLRFIDERVGIYLSGTNRWFVNQCYYNQSPSYEAGNAYAGFHVDNGPWHSNADIFFSDIAAIGTEPSTLSPGGLQLYHGILIQKADGVYVSGANLIAGTGVNLTRQSTGDNLNYIQISNVTCDNSGGTGILIDAGTFGGGFFQNIAFTNCKVQTSWNPIQPEVVITGTGITEGGVQFSNCLFSSAKWVQLFVSNASNFSFNACKFMNTNQDNLANGFSVDFQGTLSENVSFTNCQWDYVTAFGDNSYGIRIASNITNFTFVGNQVLRSVQQCINLLSTFTLDTAVISGNLFANVAGYGILSNATLLNTFIGGNTFKGNGFGSMSLQGANTSLTLGPNQYQETTPATVASATSITLPTDNYLPIIFVSGTTSIATILGGWNQRKITLVTTGILSLTSAGNIVRAFGPTVAGQTIDLIYNSSTSKWYPN